MRESSTLIARTNDCTVTYIDDYLSFRETYGGGWVDGADCCGTILNFVVSYP